MAFASSPLVTVVVDSVVLSTAILFTLGIYSFLQPGPCLATWLPLLPEAAPSWWLLSPQHRLLPAADSKQPLKPNASPAFTPVKQQAGVVLSLVKPSPSATITPPAFTTPVSWKQAWASHHLYTYQLTSAQEVASSASNLAWLPPVDKAETTPKTMAHTC